MAFQEIVNFDLHSKRNPWNATNFYEMLGVSRDGTKDLDEFEVNEVITEAWTRRLVDNPTVAANMDVYTHTNPVCWCWDREIGEVGGLGSGI